MSGINRLSPDRLYRELPAWQLAEIRRLAGVVAERAPMRVAATRTAREAMPQYERRTDREAA